MSKARHLLATLAAAAALAGCSQSLPRGVMGERYIHKYGVEVSAKEWKARGEDGQRLRKLATGAVFSETFENGVLHGDTTTTFPHVDTVAKRETFERGALVRTVDYFESGMPRSEEKQLRDGSTKLTTWYQTGTPKSVETLRSERIITGEYFNKEHELQGEVHSGSGNRVVYDVYGQLMARDTITQGYITASTTYHPNGSPKEITPYIRGSIAGQKKTFHPDGSPATIEDWENGLQHGLTLVFQNGQKVAEVSYVKGQKEGIEIRYRGEDDPVEQITWKGGRRHGKAVTAIGQTASTQYYLNDQPVSKATFKREESIR